MIIHRCVRHQAVPNALQLTDDTSQPFQSACGVTSPQWDFCPTTFHINASSRLFAKLRTGTKRKASSAAGEQQLLQHSLGKQLNLKACGSQLEQK